MPDGFVEDALPKFVWVLFGQYGKGHECVVAPTGSVANEKFHPRRFSSAICGRQEKECECETRESTFRALGFRQQKRRHDQCHRASQDQQQQDFKQGDPSHALAYTPKVKFSMSCVRMCHGVQIREAWQHEAWRDSSQKELVSIHGVLSNRIPSKKRRRDAHERPDKYQRLGNQSVLVHGRCEKQCVCAKQSTARTMPDIILRAESSVVSRQSILRWVMTACLVRARPGRSHPCRDVCNCGGDTRVRFRR